MMTLGESGIFSLPSTTTFMPQITAPAHKAKRQNVTRTNRRQVAGAQNNKIRSEDVIMAAA
jgi:hypothetical protein